MPADYRTVRLMKNRLYPTYQLHAVMAARKTTPEDGLKIGVLHKSRLCHRYCFAAGAGSMDDADCRA